MKKNITENEIKNYIGIEKLYEKLYCIESAHNNIINNLIDNMALTVLPIIRSPKLNNRDR